MVRVTQVLEAHVLGEGDWIAATEMCQLCRLDLEAVLELAALGVVAPRGSDPGQWQLPATALPRLEVVGRVVRHLGVHARGAGVAVQLPEAQRDLESRLRRLERLAADY